jgi:hypothetical protein
VGRWFFGVATKLAKASSFGSSVQFRFELTNIKVLKRARATSFELMRRQLIV